MTGDSIAILASAVFGFLATLVTQFYLARKDRLTLAFEAKREEDERQMRLVALTLLSGRLEHAAKHGHNQLVRDAFDELAEYIGDSKTD